VLKHPASYGVGDIQKQFIFRRRSWQKVCYDTYSLQSKSKVTN